MFKKCLSPVPPTLPVFRPVSLHTKAFVGRHFSTNVYLFINYFRLYALQGALAQQEWRIPTLMKQILIELKPFLTHSYMSVRDRLGSMLTNIFLSDLNFEGHGGNQRNPKMADFINEILPTLECLSHEVERESSTSEAVSSSQPLQPPLMQAMGPSMFDGSVRPPGIRGPPPEVLMRMMSPRGPVPQGRVMRRFFYLDFHIEFISN